MTDGYFDQTLNLQNLILKRKLVVQEQLAQFGRCNCNEVPNAPCCLLQTELEVLRRYSDILDRELWHMKQTPVDLTSTSDKMVSPDWKERLQAEWAQLCIRMERLDTFRDAFREGKIDFVPKWDERLLCDQLRAMRMYRDCLLQYAKLEGVELDMSLYDDSYIYDYYFNRSSEQAE